MHLPPDWREALSQVGASDLAKLGSFLEQERKQHVVFPPEDLVFRALELTPFSQVKIVILGQDPYFDGSANGLAFSCKELRPSLLNVLKELRSEFGFKLPESGDLSTWAKQGVLLLNASLTVRKGEPGSHLEEWASFTDAILKALSEQREGIVFLLWGEKAKQKEHLVNQVQHLVLKSGHPVRWDLFYQCGHFDVANRYLSKKKKPLIQWRLE